MQISLLYSSNHLISYELECNISSAAEKATQHSARFLIDKYWNKQGAEESMRMIQ